MNIAIIILNIIDVLLIYIIDIKMNNIFAEVLFDIFGGAIIALIWIKIDEYYSRTEQNLKWTSFLYLIFTLFYLIVSLIRNELKFVQPVCSPVILVCISYYAIRIKKRIEQK